MFPIGSAVIRLKSQCRSLPMSLCPFPAFMGLLRKQQVIPSLMPGSSTGGAQNPGGPVSAATVTPAPVPLVAACRGLVSADLSERHSSSSVAYNSSWCSCCVRKIRQEETQVMELSRFLHGRPRPPPCLLHVLILPTTASGSHQAAEAAVIPAEPPHSVMAR